MEAFVVSRKRRRLTPPAERNEERLPPPAEGLGENESTEVKLAMLASLFPGIEQNILLDLLLDHQGSVNACAQALYQGHTNNGTEETRLEVSPRKKAVIGSLSYQGSLLPSLKPSPASKTDGTLDAEDTIETSPRKRQLTRKGRTLHLYSPEDVAAHTPCSIIHNFLGPDEADALLLELLGEAPSFGRQTFKLFDNVVQSPHTACFYVESLKEERMQKTEYIYNGDYLKDVRRVTPQMHKISSTVRDAVNLEIAERIKSHYAGGEKLKYQSPKDWVPNAAFVNCYDGGQESVGYHSDQLTYLGPRAVIGSLSLGVSREFRVRRIVPRDEGGEEKGALRADAEGQIAIHLPHNSLLVMHAEMQEEWKHSIAPALAIDPHPISGKKRINVTYRCYRESFHPRYTPRCKCDVPAVLRCVQRKKENHGRYFWLCHAGVTPGKSGCSFFQWAEFDDDGEPNRVGASKQSESKPTTN